MRDAATKREPRDFASRMLRTAKDAGINDVLPQLDMIYTNIDLNLRIFLVRPTDKSTVDTFLSELDDRKYEWWAYAARRVDSSHRSEKAPQRSNQRPQNQTQGQYLFRPQQVGQNPFRPQQAANGYQQGPYSNNQRPAFQQRPYSAPNIPYQSNVNNQPQQYRPSQPQPQQAFRPNQGNANQYSSQTRNFTNQNQAQGQRTGNDSNRNPYRKPFVPNAAKAYHGEPSSSSSQGQENTPPDEQDLYQRYKDTFYQDTTFNKAAWAYDNSPTEGFDESNPNNEFFDNTVKAHFMSSPKALPKSVTCRNCHATFASNNKLHYHLMDCRRPPKPVAASQRPVPKPTTAASKPVAPSHRPANAFSIQIIESKAKDKPLPSRAFRGYRFATVKVSITYQGRLYEYYFNTGCTMSLIDRKFLNQIIQEGAFTLTLNA